MVDSICTCVNTIILLLQRYFIQVGEVARTASIKEENTAGSPSLELDLSGSPAGPGQGRRGTVTGQDYGGPDAESALLVKLGDDTKRNDTICWKLKTIVHRLCSTHQFKNLQVNKIFMYK